MYAYFAERGFFEEATVERRGDRVVIVERGPVHGGARHMAKDPAVKTAYCPACVVVRHALRAHHGLVVDDVKTTFQDPAAVRYDLRLARWKTKEPEEAFVYQ